MKTIKMFGKSVPLLTLVMVSLLVVGVSAGLLTYYGQMTSEVTVAQSLKLDDLSYPASGQVTEEIAGVAGNTINGPWHHLDNMADKVISVRLVSSNPEGLADVYPEFKLDAQIYDDAMRLILADSITWGEFSGISFDYEVLEAPIDPYSGYNHIPQINIKLLNSQGEVAYYASWHTFRTHIEAEEGPSSITYDKAEFYFYEVPSWALLGFYGELGESVQTLIDACDFAYFSHQAGETSLDPNTGDNEKVVLVSNHATDEAIVGIGLFDDPGLEALDFRMVYVFEDHATPGTYTVTTNIEPYP